MNKRKKKNTAVTGAAITIILLLISLIRPDLVLKPVSGNYGGTGEDLPIVVPSGTEAEGIMPDGFIHARVTRIVDGDTLEAEYKNKEYKVRLLCVDTPETKKSGVDVQPYGKQASEKLGEMTLDKNVTMVFEKDVDDRYDRLLAYIFTEDGSCVNTLLVEQGYARVDIVKPNDVHKEYFYELQEKAVEDGRGLWSLPEDKRPFVKNEKGYYVPRYVDEAA